MLKLDAYRFLICEKARLSIKALVSKASKIEEDSAFNLTDVLFRYCNLEAITYALIVIGLSIIMSEGS